MDVSVIVAIFYLLLQNSKKDRYEFNFFYTRILKKNFTGPPNVNLCYNEKRSLYRIFEKVFLIFFFSFDNYYNFVTEQSTYVCIDISLYN